MTTPESPHRVRVRYCETDRMGVAHHANYLAWFEEARTEWLRALGVNQERMLNEERRMFVVTKTELDFIVPARFNDQLIVTASLGGLSRATFGIEQNIYRDSPEGTLCCRGSVQAALLDADTLRPQRVPVSIFEES